MVKQGKDEEKLWEKMSLGRDGLQLRIDSKGVLTTEYCRFCHLGH